MPERNVVLNFLTRGDADTRTTMRTVKREADDLDGKNVDVELGANIEPAKKSFIELDLMGKNFAKKLYEARATVNDKEALLKLDKLSLKAHKLVDKPYDMKVGVDGYEKAKLDLRTLDLLADRATRTRTLNVRVNRRGGVFGGVSGPGFGGGLGGFGGGVGGIGGSAGSGAGAIGSTGPVGMTIAAILGAGAAGGLLGMIPAILGLGLGGGVGFGGAAGALAVGSQGSKKLAADRSALKQALQTLSTASKSSQAFDKARVAADERKLARDERIFGPNAGFPGVTSFPRAVAGAKAGTLTPAHSQFAITSLAPALTNLKNTGIEIFARAVAPLAKALVPIMQQIGGFVKSEGPALSNMFKASIPFIRSFVTLLEKSAKQVIPAITDVLKALSPELPLIVKGFLSLTNAFVIFLKMIGGPRHMRESVELFTGALKVAGAVIIGLGVIINMILDKLHQFAQGWTNLKNDVKKAWHAIQDSTGVAAAFLHDKFFSLWHEIAHVWGELWSGVKKRATDGWHAVSDITKHLWKDVVHFFENQKNDVTTVWDKLWGFVTSRADSAWHDVSGIAKHMWHDIVDFFQGLKRDVTGVWDRMWNDVKNSGASAINWITAKINGFIKVVDAVLGLLPGHFKIPLIPVVGGGTPSQGNAGLKHHATGAWVGGHGGPMADTEFAMLSTGERVLSHKEIHHMGGPAAVDHMAGGRGTGGNGFFAGGGTVPLTPKTGGTAGHVKPGTGPSVLSFFTDPAKKLLSLFSGPIDSLLNGIDSLIFSHLGHSGISGMIGGIGDELVQQIMLTLQGKASAAGGGGTQGMKNPYRKISLLTPERIDMGVDFAGHGPIFAIGPGVIGSTTNSGWPGGAFIEERLTGTPYAGKFVYQAENIVPTVHRGQKVDVNTVIGRMTGGIEAGWSAGTGGLTMAAKTGQQAHGVDPGGHGTWFGHNFDELLVALGVPRAPNFGAKAFGKPFPGFFNKSSGLVGKVGSRSGDIKVIFNYLKAHGYGTTAALGVLGNMGQESGWSPEAVGTGGGGLIGFTPLPRGYVTGNPQRDMATQLVATVARGRQYLGSLNKMKSIAAAVTYYMDTVERPGIPALSNRISDAFEAKKVIGMRYGGLITEPILGVGASGTRYSFGEHGVHERVTPVRSGGGGGGDIHVHVSVGPYSDPHKVAKEIHQGLRDYKRTAKGNQKLGLD